MVRFAYMLYLSYVPYNVKSFISVSLYQRVRVVYTLFQTLEREY